MTPTATTPPAGGSATHRPGHRRPLRPRLGSPLPRRVSGPAAGRAGARRAAPRPEPSFAARGVAFALALPDHPLLDRLVRARAWIPMLGVLLAGIVAMQVEVLKLGASIGRSVQATTELQSRNELLRASVASLSNEQRIESVAATMGMVMPAPDGVSFLTAQRYGNAARAAANIQPPSPSTFTASPVAGSESAASNATASSAAGAAGGASSSTGG